MDESVLKCDVLVAGGGPAGVPAAIAAARHGAKVILCQDRSVLGGNASSEVRMHMHGADFSGRRGIELQTEAREGGIIEEIRLETAVRNPHRSASMLDLIFYEKCRAEPNLTLLLDTAVVGAEVQEGRIVAAIAERQSTEDRFRIEAAVFIDCTGDGRLGAEAGAEFRHGRESRDEYGESLAPPEADSKTLGSTLLFQARDMGYPVPFVAPPWARHFTEEDLTLRKHKDLEYGYWWVEWGGTLNTIKDNAKIRDELLAILMGVWDHIKNGGDHGAENWALEWFGFLPGKRESRRFIGHYMLREQDLMESRPLPDAIAYGGWSIDLHPVEGMDVAEVKPATHHRLQYLYDIPLRSCVAKDPVNLMFAGRNISATHVAFASTRVMATCAVMGQGVGTAAAAAVRNGIAPSEFVTRPDLVAKLQQDLLRDDAFLIGISNQDPLDVARSARVTASSSQADGPAENVISGQTRAVFGEGGAHPSRVVLGTHRWMSEPSQGLPAWVELEWEKPVSPGEVRLVFDTGMHRVLTLSHANANQRKMIWGKPQPETVRDYTIQAYANGEWVDLVQVSGNYQRLRVHRIDQPIATTRIRINCLATQGLDHARICEVRVYEA